ncbi:MAG: hypothetical protein AAGB48_12065 [Planctomycetota bacterium]
MRRQNVIAISLIAPASLVGCTGVEPALIGVGVTAAEAGVAIVDGTDVHAFELARYGDVVAALERAVNTLELERYSRRFIDHQHFVDRYRLGNNRSLVVEIRSVTGSVTMVRTEIKSTLHRGMAALLVRQTYHELSEAGAYLEEWAGSSEDSRNLVD